jgi:hypothetical protein
MRKVLIGVLAAALLLPAIPAQAHDRGVGDANDTWTPLDISGAAVGHTASRTFGVVQTYPTFPNRYLNTRGALFMDVGNRYVFIYARYGVLKAQVRRYTANGSAWVASARASRLSADTLGFSAPRWALPIRSGTSWYAASVWGNTWDYTPTRTHW